jgi:hypothetical protein
VETLISEGKELMDSIKKARILKIQRRDIQRQMSTDLN